MKQKAHYLSIFALITCLLPLTTFIPVLLKFSLTGTMQVVRAIVNIICIILSFTLSIVYVKTKKTRNIYNIISTGISVIFCLNVIGIIFIAFVTNII